MSKEAMTLALEALNTPRPSDSYPPLWRAYENTINTAIKALEEALAKQEQNEPVAWMTETGSVWKTREKNTDIPLYTTPQPAPQSEARKLSQQKPWVGLTDEQLLRLLSRIDECAVRLPRGLREFARAIEAAHGIKENT